MSSVPIGIKKFMIGVNDGRRAISTFGILHNDGLKTINHTQHDPVYKLFYAIAKNTASVLKTTYMKRLLFMFIPVVLVLLAFRAFKSYTVNGKITDDKGSPIVSVSVIVKGTNVAA